MLLKLIIASPTSKEDLKINRSQMSKIEIYTRPGCGYCTHAKRLLKNKGLSFVEYDVYQNPAYIYQLQKRTTEKTYPQVFIENQSVGGFTELLAIEQQDLLPSG
jgi:glutaredoxin 3